MHKWISIIAILTLFLSFSGGKIVEGEALSSPNEIDKETVTPPELRVYTVKNMYTEKANSAITVLTHQTYEEKTDNFERNVEEEEEKFMRSTFQNEYLNENGISPLKVNKGEKISLVMFINNRPNVELLSEPDKIEVKQINSDEKVNVKVTDKKSEHNQITAPKESGNYHYSVVIHWNELQLKASYVFDVIVR